jgi:hypothetical protein
MAQNPQGQSQSQSKLENITSTSFPANHLLQFSIVKQEAEQSYKKAYFFFITLAPGVQNPQGGRTFDFNNRVTMKVESYQIDELAHALRSFARGQETQLGPHSIYVDSGKSAYGAQGAGGKSLTIQKTQTQPKQGDNRPPAPLVTFFFKQGTNQALGYSMSPYRALAIADKLAAMSEHCDKLEMARGPVGNQTGAYENPNPTGFADTPPISGPGGPAGGVASDFGGFNNDDVPF